MKETLSNDEGMTELRIRAPKEFGFAENLKYLSRSSNECMFEIVDQKIYRALVVDNETLLVEISSMNETELTVRFPGRTAPVKNM